MQRNQYLSPLNELVHKCFQLWYNSLFIHTQGSPFFYVHPLQSYLFIHVFIMCRYEGQLMAFLWRFFVVTFFGGIIILGRVLISRGSPMFVESDNPASFSDVFLTRTLTYLYLIPFNIWLLLCPSHLCFDWSMGSIPLVESLTDWRNFETIVCFISLITLGIKCK